MQISPPSAYPLCPGNRATAARANLDELHPTLDPVDAAHPAGLKPLVRTRNDPQAPIGMRRMGAERRMPTSVHTSAPFRKGEWRPGELVPELTG